MIDRKIFFDSVRASLFGGGLNAGQVDGISRIFDEWIRSQIPEPRFLAYMLATVFHETAQTMQPIREMGSEEYLRSKSYYPWVGEGLVQVTWEANARKFGATAPGQLMTWPLCLKPLFDGMTRGMFTGKRLADYFNATTDDPVNARRIINGTDRANLIAMYHGNFLAALKASEKPATGLNPIPAPTIPKPPPPAPRPQIKPPTEVLDAMPLWGTFIVWLMSFLQPRPAALGFISNQKGNTMFSGFKTYGLALTGIGSVITSFLGNGMPAQQAVIYIFALLIAMALRAGMPKGAVILATKGIDEVGKITTSPAVDDLVVIVDAAVAKAIANTSTTTTVITAK